MIINDNLKDGLNLVLNEATFLDLNFIETQNIIVCKLDLLKNNGNPFPNIVFFVLRNVKRFAAKYSITDSSGESVIKFDFSEISIRLKDFIFKDLYGWDFINTEESVIDLNKENLSFNYCIEDNFEIFNSIKLFQESFEKDIDIKIWFEELEILDENKNLLNFDSVISQQNDIWKMIFGK